MLSKEEIEESKECLQETIRNTYGEGKAIKLNNLLEYIEKLESDKQKLIEKLEKDKMEQFDDYIIYLIESYLKILKGENDEH